MKLNDALDLTIAEDNAGRDISYPLLNSARPVGEHGVDAVWECLLGFDDIGELLNVSEEHMGGNCWWTVIVHGERCHVLYWDGWFEVTYRKGETYRDLLTRIDTETQAPDWQPIAAGDCTND